MNLHPVTPALDSVLAIGDTSATRSITLTAGTLTAASLKATGMTIAGFVKNAVTTGLLSGGNAIVVGDINGLISATSPIIWTSATGVISHAATAGNIHLPTGGLSNQILKNSGTSGTGSWGTVTENTGALAAITTLGMAGALTNTLPAATATGLYINGTSTGYTGTADNYGIRVERTVSTAAGANYFASYLASYTLTNDHACNGTLESYLVANFGGNNNLLVTGAHSATDAGLFDFTENNYGLRNAVSRSGILTAHCQDAPGEFIISNYGLHNAVTDSSAYNHAGGDLLVNNYGGYFNVICSGAQTAGTLTKNNYGFFATVSSTGAGGTVTNYGAYINQVTGGTVNWGIYDKSGAQGSILGALALGKNTAPTVNTLNLAAAFNLLKDTNDLTITCASGKTLVLSPTVYKDINIAGYLLAKPASAAPGVDTFRSTGGTDTLIETLAFAVGEKVHGGFELQHDYKEGTDLVFHVHWQGIAAPAGGTDNVQWRITYIVARDGVTLAAATTIDSPDVAITTQYRCYRNDFGAITGTNFKIGDQFMFTLERVAAVSDDYAGDCLIETTGIHYQVDTLGSRSISAK